MRHRISRLTGRRKTGGVLLATAAMVSTVLVGTTAGVSGAEAVSANIPLVCVGADSKTIETLNLAKPLIGSDTVPVNLVATGDVPATAGLEQDINAEFSWAGTMGQGLVDKAAELGLALQVTNIKTAMSVKGPSSVDAFQSTGTDTNITPVAGKPASLNMGKIGGPIKTTGGGIITYRVGTVTLSTALDLKGQKFNLNLSCSPTGSNLIAKTTVKDPDAPTFDPEVVKLDAAAGGTATVNLLGDVIKPGKTPLMNDSLKIVESPAAGTATLTDGVFSFTAPTEAGTYSTTVEICGEPKPESGAPGINEVQKLQLGDNWTPGLLGPRPVGFTLKFGDEVTNVIWTAESTLGPILDPFPRGGKMPNSKDWAPADREGQISDYLFLTEYKQPTAVEVRHALESLPSIGKGNVEVTNIRKDENDDKSAVVAFSIQFINELAEQDVAQVSLDSWFSVPPQEILDRIGEAIAGLAGSLGGDGNTELSPFEKAAGIKEDDTQQARTDKANAYMGSRILESIGDPSKALSDAEWEGWADAVIFSPLMGAITDAVPAIITWLNSLFPKKVVLSTLVPGEAPTPPEPLCAQGIIDVTVAGTDVAPETTVAPGPEVLGTPPAERGIGITG